MNKFTRLIGFLFLMATLSACQKDDIDMETNNDDEIVYVPYSDELNVASVNIRFSNQTDGVNNWSNRKFWLVDFINFFDLDVVGLQEEKNDQISDLRNMLEGYSLIGLASSNQPGYEYNSIVYRPAAVEVLDWGRFWLSETPDEESVGWNAIYHRQVTWAKFKQKATDKAFFFFNTHFTHIDAPTRAHSARLMKEKIASIAQGAPSVATGDINSWPDSEPYNILTKTADPGAVLLDGRKQVERPYGANYTGHCFGTCYQDGKIVDYVFVTDKVEVLKYGIVNERRIDPVTKEEVFLSDHYPVLSTIKLK